MEFKFTSEEIFIYGVVDRRYDLTDAKYRIIYGLFDFNSFEVSESIYKKNGLKIPFLKVYIELLLEEWKKVKECLWFVRWIRFFWTRDWGIIRDQGEP